MRRLSILMLVLFLSNFVSFSQIPAIDPTFSQQNYKHPNKAKQSWWKNKRSSLDEYVRPENCKASASPSVLKSTRLRVTTNHSGSREAINYKQNFTPRAAINKQEEIRKFLEKIRAN